MNKQLSIGILVAAAALITGLASAANLRIGCGNPKGAITCDAHEHFADLLRQKSGGSLTATVFYQSLGSEAELAQSVISGSVDVGDMSNGNATRFSRAFQLYDLPFLFKNVDTLASSLRGDLGKQTIAAFESQSGLVFLFPTMFGTGRDIQTTKKQLKVPADIKGLKIRAIATPVDQAIFKAWGANPTPVDFGQLFAALQQGVVDGEQVTVSVVLTSNHYEVIKYNLRIDYQMLFTVNYMNKRKFESLSDEHRKIVREAAAETAMWQLKDSSARVGKLIQELEKKGVSMYTPTAEEYRQWTEARTEVWKDVASKSNGAIDLRVAQQIYDSQK